MTVFAFADNSAFSTTTDAPIILAPRNGTLVVRIRVPFSWGWKYSPSRQLEGYMPDAWFVLLAWKPRLSLLVRRIPSSYSTNIKWRPLKDEP